MAAGRERALARAALDGENGVVRWDERQDGNLCRGSAEPCFSVRVRKTAPGAASEMALRGRSQDSRSDCFITVTSTRSVAIAPCA